jgi:hypothetical protein
MAVLNGNDAKAADHLGRIADFLGPQDILCLKLSMF